MPPPRDAQYISLSPTESPVDDADMESGAVALGPASQVECQELRKGLTFFFFAGAVRARSSDGHQSIG